jgi:hypothetical protein
MRARPLVILTDGASTVQVGQLQPAKEIGSSLIPALREADETAEALGGAADLRGGLPAGRDVNLHHPIE